MCLQLLEFIKSRGNFLDLIFKHFATPVIMDLLLQIIKEVQGGTLKKNLYEVSVERGVLEVHNNSHHLSLCFIVAHRTEIS